MRIADVESAAVASPPFGFWVHDAPAAIIIAIPNANFFIIVEFENVADIYYEKHTAKVRVFSFRV